MTRPVYRYGKRVNDGRYDPAENRTRICVHVDSRIVEWMDAVARTRGVGRECIVESALMAMKSDMPR